MVKAATAVVDSRIQAGLRRSASLLLVTVALVSLLILSAWWVPALASHLPDGWHLMKANTAFGMLLAACGLWVGTGKALPALRHVRAALGVSLLFLALLTLFEYQSHTSTGVDTWLAADLGSPLPGRMSAQTATGLTMLALAVLTLEYRRGLAALAADIIALVVVAFVLLLAAGYAFGALRIYGVSEAIRVSPQTLLCFMLLGVVICIRRSASGPLAVLRGGGIGSRTARIAVPGAILLPFLLAAVRGFVVVRGTLAANTAGALTLTVLCMCAAGLVLFLSWRINHLEGQVLDLSLRRSREALKESEQRYEELVDQALEGITVRKPSGEFLFVNDAYCRMLGYARVELLQMSIRDVVHPEDAETITQVQRLDSGGSLHLRKRMRRKDGGVVHVEVSVRRLRDGSFQSTVQDVSDRNRGEERFKAMVEGSPTAMLMVSERGDIVMANPQADRLFGYEKGELQAKSVDTLVPEPFRSLHPALRAGFHRAPKARLMGTGRDLYGLRKSGDRVPVEIGLNPVETPEGHFVLASIIDISERKHAEERFRAMVEGSPSAMLMVNAEGTILLVNPQTEKMFGYRREELLGKPVETLIPSSVRGRHPALREGFQRNPQVRAMGKGRELFGLHKDGHEIPVEIGLNPVTTHEGQCVMASVIDITERLQAQEMQRNLPKQLLDAQEAERRRIARELHDEVGQALTASQIRLRDLEAQLRGAVGAKDAAEISQMVATLLQQVRQLSLDLRPSVLDDLGLAAAIRWFMRERVSQGRMQVVLDVPLTLPRAPAQSETAMFRVFQSSMTNILRHAEAGRVKVSLCVEALQLILEIHDDGKGFDLDAARRRARQGGSLGLLGMEEWIQLSGGVFAIESAPGRGTTVRASVPVPPVAEDDLGQDIKGG